MHVYVLSQHCPIVVSVSTHCKKKKGTRSSNTEKRAANERKKNSNSTPKPPYVFHPSPLGGLTFLFIVRARLHPLPHLLHAVCSEQCIHRAPQGEAQLGHHCIQGLHH